MAPIRRYLRISKHSVLECRIFLENPADGPRWLLNPQDPALPRVFEAIKPLVLPKLREENERAKGSKGKKKKSVKDVVKQGRSSSLTRVSSMSKVFVQTISRFPYSSPKSARGIRYWSKAKRSRRRISEISPATTMTLSSFEKIVMERMGRRLQTYPLWIATTSRCWSRQRSARSRRRAVAGSQTTIRKSWPSEHHT